MRLRINADPAMPAEEALAADGDIVFPRSDLFEEELEVVVFDVHVQELLAFPVHDADVDGAGMKIDSAVESSSRDVVSHSMTFLVKG